MGRFSVRDLLTARRGEDLDLWARTINPQFVRVLRTIDFDRAWARAEGAYLWDEDGNRFLDMLGGFGMYNVGRNNPRVRAALSEALDLETPGMLALGTTLLPGLLAEALLALAPARLQRCLFTSSGSAARKFRYEAQAGNIGINIGVAAPMAFFPFSGWRESFFGTLHGQGRHAVEFYTQTKVVVERWLKDWSRKF